MNSKRNKPFVHKSTFGVDCRSEGLLKMIQVAHALLQRVTTRYFCSDIIVDISLI